MAGCVSCVMVSVSTCGSADRGEGEEGRPAPGAAVSSLAQQARALGSTRVLGPCTAAVACTPHPTRTPAYSMSSSSCASRPPPSGWSASFSYPASVCACAPPWPGEGACKPGSMVAQAPLHCPSRRVPPHAQQHRHIAATLHGGVLRPAWAATSRSRETKTHLRSHRPRQRQSCRSRARTAPPRRPPAGSLSGPTAAPTASASGAWTQLACARVCARLGQGGEGSLQGRQTGGGGPSARWWGAQHSCRCVRSSSARSTHHTQPGVPGGG